MTGVLFVHGSEAVAVAVAAMAVHRTPAVDCLRLAIAPGLWALCFNSAEAVERAREFEAVARSLCVTSAQLSRSMATARAKQAPS